MRRYLVRFLKDVVGDDMHQREVCQGWYELEANNEKEAAEIGKRRFCQQQEIGDWSFHADRVEVLESEFPS
ncbi:hypothetical protein [Lutibaculum baratangense]|uniref:Uncharacterized protein n=1 Tax=Lutibaculum baratangense AMV1 TaxID=631454 RepID=V4QW58_9HYPH|nr:hypothetical protein [Lutibaculum baratangense]ESR23957.1 hypothetical protein N177_2726 [Lutibaculum baratangense AMV1]